MNVDDIPQVRALIAPGRLVKVYLKIDLRFTYEWADWDIIALMNGSLNMIISTGVINNAVTKLHTPLESKTFTNSFFGPFSPPTFLP